MDNPRIIIKHHCYRICEACMQQHKEKWLGKINGHYICNRCQRSNKRWVEKPQGNDQRIFRREEISELWSHGKKLGLSDEQIKARIRSLRFSVARSRRLAKIQANYDRKSFKDSFSEMVQGRKK